MSSIVVRKVEDKSEYKDFFEFPWALYKDNPYWVPPLKSVRKHLLDREHDASWEYMEGDFFVAYKDGTPAGTIAAFINHRHNETWQEHIGWFGAFEFIDDPTVSRALLTAAEDYIKGKGYDAIRGPVNFNLNGEIGVLLDSYDRMPMILMPYNMAYYPQHYEQAGYVKAKDVITWAGNKATLGLEGGIIPERLVRVVEKNNQRRGITVRAGNRKTIKEDFQIIYELYNTAWKDNWGFVPLTKRELDALIRDLKQFYVPEITFFAFVKGNPAGFVLAVPNMNQPIHKAYPRPGVPEIVSLLKILWHWKIRPVITEARTPLMGVKEEYRGIGVDGAILLHLFSMVHKTKYSFYEGGWVLEDNEDVNIMTRNYQAYVDRRYRIYEKALK